MVVAALRRRRIGILVFDTKDRPAKPGGFALCRQRVLEFGCGQGFGLSLQAAANPDVAFEGYGPATKSFRCMIAIGLGISPKPVPQ